MSLLELNGVCAAYGQSQVLWEVDMHVAPGSAVALIGRNGVGKTTLLNAIAGVHKLSGGTIVFNGTDVSTAPAHGRARAGIGFVPQGRHVFPHLTVMENLTVGLAALTGRKGVTESGIAAHIFDLFPKLTEIRQRKAGSSPSAGRWPGNPGCCCWTSPPRAFSPTWCNRLRRRCAACARSWG